MRPRLATAVLMIVILCIGGITAAHQTNPQDPGGPPRHHLNAAARLAREAGEKIREAQAANEWDLEGHAQKARELLDQAVRELNQSVQR